MNGYTGAVSPSGPMYVRALYDYDADDRTSLSFRQGDIIQVITQLESGWWDGVINGVRGWFPSNYCTIVQRGMDDDYGGQTALDMEGDPHDSFGEGGYPTDADDSEAENDPGLPIEGNVDRHQDEAAFWIPQATSDGRLYYFNTMTGISTMELPLETPGSISETGPLDRTHVNMPESTRVPPELMAGGYSVDDTTDDETSDVEGRSGMTGSSYSMGRRRSFISDGVSPATSMESMNPSNPKTRNRGDMNGSNAPSFSAAHGSMPPLGTGMTSFAANPAGPPLGAAAPRKFYEDIHAVPLTWNRMVEDMRRAIERYRQAIQNSDRSEYVKRAEDISDHLRLILAAGSGTTDNHSGNPSIISTNKALYPHFRETMSRFSKLVLSSHIAAADWPPPDSYAKCLKEADGVLNGVYGFVDVARQQRGEDIPRLIPGFVVGSNAGGNWQNNGLADKEATSFIDQDDYEPFVEPTAKLDAAVVERLMDLRRMITSGLRRLDEYLVVPNKVITPSRHEIMGNHICNAAGKALEVFRPWMSTIESINLSTLAATLQGQDLGEFTILKQRVYDLVSELVVSCQAVASPLADEWSESRGDSIEDRVNAVQAVSKDLDSSIGSLCSLLQQLSDSMPADERSSRQPQHDSRQTSIDANMESVRDRSLSTASRPMLNHAKNPEPPKNSGSNPAKVMKFFGEVPAPVMQNQVEDVPEFLRLDCEGEISYDTKVTPPQLRGGTLPGLVEQLTRHDRLDSSFNNTFLLTYRSFTTASELFEMLVKRWSVQPPMGLDKEDYQTWVDKKQKPIRFRVVNILKSWFDTYWMEADSEESRMLIQRIYQFAKDQVATTSTPGANPLMTSVDQRARGQEPAPKRMILTNSTPLPTPILPKSMKKLKFLDIDPTEFSRQLTIIESRLYSKIKSTECLNKTWQKKINAGDSDPAPNVKALILHSNQLTNWVAQMILTQQDVRKRVVVIKHFVNVADRCRQLNNFSTLTSIISALGTAPIHRLNRTWTQVNARTMATLESMRKLMGSTKNFLEYRETLHRVNPPCIPFFGVYLTDLTFIEDGIPSLIKKTNLINFAKRAKTAEVIRDIQQYQNVPFALQPVQELQDYILTNMHSAGDVHEMYDQSLQLEPREREDEKIARLLSESGFL